MNYSFYDEMDWLDDILTESSEDEEFLESIAVQCTGVAIGLGVAKEVNSKRFDKWACQTFGIQVPFKACKYRKIKLNKNTLAEVSSYFKSNKSWVEKSVNSNATCYLLLYNDKPVYAALCVATLNDKIKRSDNGCICEEFYGANKNAIMGYYALMLFSRKCMPVTPSAIRMNNQFKNAERTSIL